MQVDEAVARIRRRVGDYVFVGGWISPGEKAVRDMLLADPKGRIIQILPSAMPHDYKVGSLWLGAIRSRRAAIIARGNSEVEFSRAACLEVNEAAARMAVGLTTQALSSGQESSQASVQDQARASGPGRLQASVQGQARASVLGRLQALGQGEALPDGKRILMGAGRLCGKAVYWLPEGPKVVS